MILSSPSVSHAPGSIYPDIPSQQNTHLRTNTTPSVDPSRRHTSYLPSSPRREIRPLRSSPLAGPSIVQDGSLTGSDESGSSQINEERRKFRPNRISSIPEVPSTFGRPASLCSPSGISIDIHSPASDVSEISEYGSSPSDLPSPTEPEPAKRSRRLSWGIVKLTPLPALPARSPSSRSSKRNSYRPPSPPPPVPDIPTWALPSSPISPARRSAVSLSAASARRPSTAPTVPSSRSSVCLGHCTGPSTSRDPELNWLSSAAPPKFSRLSLKAEGVILPVSAKDASKLAKRRSTATISGSSPPYHYLPAAPESKDDKGSKGKGQKSCPPSRMPSTTSLASLGSQISTSSVPLPAPPFSTTSRNNSLSSLASGASSMNAPTPSLSLSRTSSAGSATEPDEMGVLRGLETALGSSTSAGEFQKAVVGVEVRVNDVCVDVIATSDASKAGKAQVLGASTATLVKDPAAPVKAPVSSTNAPRKLERGKGTIKRLWKRVVGSVKH
ncbi:hypothetical protein NLI96_g324 [Meripilus lineatus]|uniref:Uncharacterized protein n=1 Tax=Meripilus lineatus TaxID=2056292 RepID=A0AAD5YJG8_9APHY|nr:hypothetical protein NLI96_g324 [Physisporinus lineatus]